MISGVPVIFAGNCGATRCCPFFAARSPCLVAVEAGPGTHYWRREIIRGRMASLPCCRRLCCSIGICTASKPQKNVHGIKPETPIVRRSNVPTSTVQAQFGGRGDGIAQQAPTKSRLVEIAGFGSNPGTLKAWLFLPSIMAPDARLWCAAWLHTDGRGLCNWIRLVSTRRATRICGALSRAAAIEQCQPCFNWFEPGDIRRDAGEALSIRQMIGHLRPVARHRSKRIFVTGLSAGGRNGERHAVDLSRHIAGGAIISGLPYGVAARSLRRSSECKANPPTVSRLQSVLKSASNHKGLCLDFDTGTEHDQTVRPGNATRSSSNGPAFTPRHGANSERVDTRAIPANFVDAKGSRFVEAYSVKGMAHGVPLAERAAMYRSGEPVPHA